MLVVDIRVSVIHVERQAQRVPVAVLPERATAERGTDEETVRCRYQVGILLQSRPVVIKQRDVCIYNGEQPSFQIKLTFIVTYTGVCSPNRIVAYGSRLEGNDTVPGCFWGD